MFATVLTFLGLVLAACGTASNGAQSGSDPLGNPSADALPESSQLVIGTLKLDGTDRAVGAEQAAELLPLWQTYLSLSASDTAAREELEALVEQIRDAMTPEQMQAIADMQLTRDDMFAVMQEQGIGVGAGPQAGDSITGGSPDFAPPDGGAGFPAGGGGLQGGPAGEQSLSPDQIATAQAARAAGGGAPGFDRLPTPLLNVLIEFLRAKAGA
jgi:hypothetical protein